MIYSRFLLVVIMVLDVLPLGAMTLNTRTSLNKEAATLYDAIVANNRDEDVARLQAIIDEFRKAKDYLIALDLEKKLYQASMLYCQAQGKKTVNDTVAKQKDELKRESDVVTDTKKEQDSLRMRLNVSVEALDKELDDIQKNVELK